MKTIGELSFGNACAGSWLLALFFSVCGTLSAVAAVEIQVRGASPDDDFLTWAPALGKLRQTTTGAVLPVTLRNADPSNGGQLVFGTKTAGVAPSEAATKDTLALTLPADGSWVEFYVAGKFPFPSFGKKDAILQAVTGSGAGTEAGRLALMVRVRKNANTLTDDERKIFLEALKEFRKTTNSTGESFGIFHDIHTEDGYWQAHQQNGFLPWHRAFLLHLERRLQQINPHVTLPYWRFDRAAPNIFSQQFLGAPPSGTSVNAILASTNPLFGWSIPRQPTFSANQAPSGILSQKATVALGTAFDVFTQMEGDPHGSAHVNAGRSNTSWVFHPFTAAQDPIFFLLHCHVDHLWARWQIVHNRFGTDDATYRPRGTFPPAPPQELINGYASETMWPWNDKQDNSPDTNRPEDRPGAAPGGPLPVVAGLAPGPQPKPVEMLDYLGLGIMDAQLGFCYDDVGLKVFTNND